MTPAEPTPKVERFGCSPDGYGGRHGEQCVWAYDYDILLDQLTAALARAEAAEKDARRYAWLRDNVYVGIDEYRSGKTYSWELDLPATAQDNKQEHFDAAIDAMVRP